jgi:hypothetical protein
LGGSGVKEEEHNQLKYVLKYVLMRDKSTDIGHTGTAYLDAYPAFGRGHIFKIASYRNDNS